MNTQKEEADKYQGLFNLMSKEHNLTLTISEMDNIIREAQKVVHLENRKLSNQISELIKEKEAKNYYNNIKCVNIYRQIFNL
jgi:hypothetical protein